MLIIIKQPWGKVYHIAYSTVGYDEIYGTLGLYECDRKGLYCWQIHSLNRIMVDTLGGFKLKYNAETERMSIGFSGSERIMYVRSRSGSFEHRDRR